MSDIYETVYTKNSRVGINTDVRDDFTPNSWSDGNLRVPNDINAYQLAIIAKGSTVRYSYGREEPAGSGNYISDPTKKGDVDYANGLFVKSSSTVGLLADSTVSGSSYGRLAVFENEQTEGSHNNRPYLFRHYGSPDGWNAGRASGGCGLFVIDSVGPAGDNGNTALSYFNTGVSFLVGRNLDNEHRTTNFFVKQNGYVGINTTHAMLNSLLTVTEDDGDKSLPSTATWRGRIACGTSTTKVVAGYHTISQGACIGAHITEINNNDADNTYDAVTNWDHLYINPTTNANVMIGSTREPNGGKLHIAGNGQVLILEGNAPDASLNWVQPVWIDFFKANPTVNDLRSFTGDSENTQRLGYIGFTSEAEDASGNMEIASALGAVNITAHDTASINSQYGVTLKSEKSGFLLQAGDGGTDPDGQGDGKFTFKTTRSISGTDYQTDSFIFDFNAYDNLPTTNTPATFKRTNIIMGGYNNLPAIWSDGGANTSFSILINPPYWRGNEYGYGKVGIGITGMPSEMLEVGGSIKSNGNITSAGQITSGGNIRLEGADIDSYNSAGLYLNSGSNKNIIMVSNVDGYVGIGTNNPIAALDIGKGKAVAADEGPGEGSHFLNYDSYEWIHNSNNDEGGWGVDSKTLYAARKAGGPNGGDIRMVHFFGGDNRSDGSVDQVSQWNPIAYTGSSTLSLRTKNSVWIQNRLYFTSDERIKENIREVQDDVALKTVRDISCVLYEYKDKYDRGYETTIGFIAQQVARNFPLAITIKGGYIPNEFRYIENPIWEEVDISGSKKFKLTIDDLEDISGNIEDISGNIEYKIYFKNDLSSNDITEKCVYTLEDDPKSFILDQSWNHIFLYGKKVYDLHIVDKQKLFTLNFSATQEIDRIQQRQLIDISENKLSISKNEVDVELLKLEIVELRENNTELLDKINNLENEKNDLITRLEMIEQRLNNANI
jgi:hypothetical protein